MELSGWVSPFLQQEHKLKTSLLGILETDKSVKRRNQWEKGGGGEKDISLIILFSLQT